MIVVTDINKLKAEFTKERAFDGMMFLLPVAECTIKISTKRFTPARSQRARIIQRQPLKWGAVTLALPEVTTDTAARDAAITSPAKGMIVIAATTFYGYTGAAWVALS